VVVKLVWGSWSVVVFVKDLSEVSYSREKRMQRLIHVCKRSTIQSIRGEIVIYSGNLVGELREIRTKFGAEIFSEYRCIRVE